MIAVTIGIGEKYAKLARHASQAVQKMTGLKTIILDDRHFAASGLSQPHYLKLRVFDFVSDDAVMFFDSDMVCLNQWNPEHLARNDALVAVVERPVATITRICQAWEIPWHEYFNAGLMVLNRQTHWDWLRETERFVLTNKRFREYDPYDQAALNITRHRMGLKLELLDRRYNWIGFGSGNLCFNVPVFMAHGVCDGNRFANLDYFEGKTKLPLDWHIRIDEDEMNRLKNQTLRVNGGHWEKSLRLNSDGTIGPPFYPGMGCYWFAYTKADGRGLAIASQKELVQEFTKAGQDSWESVQELRPDVH